MTIRTTSIPLQHPSRGCSRAFVLLLFLYGFVLWSPITVVLGLRWSLLTATIVAAVLALSLLLRRPLKSWFLVAAALTLASAAVTATYWQEFRLLLFPVPFLTGLLLLCQATPREIEKVADVATWFVLVLLVTAAVSFVMALGGMPPILEFPRPGSPQETIFLFGATLTNVHYGPVIRPAGIYDEPGALSFVVCLVAFLRHAMGKDYRVTWLLLLLGFVTLSLAHLVFTVVFFLSERVTIRNVGFAVLIALLATVPLLSAGVRDAFRDYLVARAVVTNSGRLAGDNRSSNMLNAWDIVRSDDRVIWFGVGPECSVDAQACFAKHPSLGQNPLQHLAERGIFGSWQYYLFLLFGIAVVLTGRSNLAFFAVALLFMQRPYLFSFGYSLFGALAFWVQTSAHAPQLRARGAGAKPAPAPVTEPA